MQRTSSEAACPRNYARPEFVGSCFVLHSSCVFGTGPVTISDHASVLVRVEVPTPCVDVLGRTIWDFKHADWKGLLASFGGMVWDEVLSREDPNGSVDIFASTILEVAQRHIPRKNISERKGKHPWLDEKCLRAIQRKATSSSTPAFEEAARACTEAIASAYAACIKKKKVELQALKRGSKNWWMVAKSLLDGASNKSQAFLRGESQAANGSTMLVKRQMSSLKCCPTNSWTFATDNSPRRLIKHYCGVVFFFRFSLFSEPSKYQCSKQSTNKLTTRQFFKFSPTPYAHKTQKKHKQTHTH